MKFNYAIPLAGFRTPAHYLRLIFASIMSLMLPVAARAAGLSSGTSELSDLRIWMYGCLAIIVLGWLIWRALQCLADKRPWMDFFIGFGICACVGGCIAGGEYGWALWGS